MKVLWTTHDFGVRGSKKRRIFPPRTKETIEDRDVVFVSAAQVGLAGSRRKIGNFKPRNLCADIERDQKKKEGFIVVTYFTGRHASASGPL